MVIAGSEALAAATAPPLAVVSYPPTARRAADYVLTFKDGAVVRVDILTPGGAHVTADGFVGDHG